MARGKLSRRASFSRMITRRLAGLHAARRFVAAVFLSAFCAQAGWASVVSVDDAARVLAGLPPSAGSPLEAITSGNAWKSQAGSFSEAWKRFETSQLSRARAWADRELPDARQSAPVLYYAFSGPDIVYANTFFPDSKTYVLCGLEPVGHVPDLLALAPAKTGDALRRLHASLANILSLSFFITKNMSSDLRSPVLPGTTPILLTFLARLGKTVRDATPVALDSSGNEVAVDAAANRKDLIPGIKIVFDSGSGTPAQTVYYFSTNISNEGLKNNEGFANFCRKLLPGAGFVKAASYLMHGSQFSSVRDLLLERCHLILQDDTGIPATVLAEQNWQIRPYGRYKGPIKMFRGYHQKKLDQIFAAAEQKPLDFGIGYHYRADGSSMVLASRGDAPAQDDLPAVVAAAPAANSAPADIVPAPAPAPTPSAAQASAAPASAPEAALRPADPKAAKKALVALEDEELRIRADASLTRAERARKLREVWDKQLAVMGKSAKRS